MELGGSSGLVNIGGGSEDAHYRYKMPRIMGKIEGRGNGIKTRIVNCSQIAKALHRPPGYICKFFGCELGAQTKISDDEDVYIVNGAHDQKLLADTLDKFVRMFVLCPSCNMPETDLVIDKRGNIYHVCNACGAQHLVDMSHRVTTYMLNNPPDGARSKKSGKSKKERKESKKKKGHEKGSNVHEEAPDADDAPDSGTDGKTKKKKSSKRRDGETEEAYRERRAAEKAARRQERAAQKAGASAPWHANGTEALVAPTDLDALAQEAEAMNAALNQRRRQTYATGQEDSELDESGSGDTSPSSPAAAQPHGFPSDAAQRHAGDRGMRTASHKSGGHLESDRNALRPNGDHHYNDDDDHEDDDDDDDDDGEDPQADGDWTAHDDQTTSQMKLAAARAAALLTNAGVNGNGESPQRAVSKTTSKLDELHLVSSKGTVQRATTDVSVDDEKLDRFEAWLRQGHHSPASIASEARKYFPNDSASAAQAIFCAVVAHAAHPECTPGESPARHAVHAVDALRALSLNHAAQARLLDAFEALAGVGSDEARNLAPSDVQRGAKRSLQSRLNSIPHILKLFYDEDILDEQVIIDWFTRRSPGSSTAAGERARDAAKPLVEWLQQPSEAEDSTEE
jgi:translation initiation factor 2 beta subunit (eIF-2beta)/eIF-5